MSNKTAQGCIVRGSYGKVIAYFVVEGSMYSFSASISPNVQPFTSGNATLTYADKRDLTEAHSINGTIGKASIELSFDNGPSAKGDLNNPVLSTTSTVSGSGSWETL